MEGVSGFGGKAGPDGGVGLGGIAIPEDVLTIRDARHDTSFSKQTLRKTAVK